MKWWFVSELMYTTCTTVVRLSIGTFLLRIAARPLHRRIVFTVMAASAIACVYLVLLVTFQCKPVAFFWDKTQPGACVNPILIAGSTYAFGGVSTICDLTYGILPIYLIMCLNMNRRSKLLAATILSLAAL